LEAIAKANEQVAKYLSTLGDLVLTREEHPCHSITDSKDLFTMPTLVANMGKACRFSLQFKLTVEEEAKLPTLSELGCDSFGTCIARPEKVINAWITDNVFVERVSSLQSFEAVTGDMLVNMNGQMLAQLPYLKEMTVKHFAKLPAGAFTHLTATMVAGMKEGAAVFIAGLSAEQFAQLSAEVRPEESAFTIFDEAIIKSFDVQRVGALTSVTLAIIPAKEWAAFSKAQVEQISPAACKTVTKDQLMGLSEDALSGLTLAQVEAVGADVMEEDQKPIHFFTKDVVAKLSSASRKAAVVRFDSSASMVGASFAAVSVAVVLALLI